MKDFAKGFYDGITWRRCREDFINKRRMIDGGMCQRCHKNLGYIVHHKIELTQDNITDDTIALNHDNLEYLCHDCHNIEHDVFQNRNRIAFDENGDVIQKIFESPQKF